MAVLPGFVVLVGALFGLLDTGWTDSGLNGEELQQKWPMPKKTIEEVLKQHTPSLMAVPGVVGTAQGSCSGKPCIKVFVAEKTPELLKQIPSSLEGYPVEVQETGEIRALDSS